MSNLRQSFQTVFFRLKKVDTTMTKFSFAIITPSYAPDFERCQLLSWSINQFVSPSITHYIIVDQRDLSLFRQLKRPNTEIITVESVMPWWIKRLPLMKNGWLSLKTIFIRNWIVQQLVKIAIPQYIKEDVLAFVDSDTAFVRPFNFESFIREGKVRLYQKPICDNPETHLKWNKTAHKLLGLPLVNFPFPGYIGNVITWKRDNVLKLYQKLESISGRGWLETLTSSWHLSEYTLYGVFVEHILKEESGHYFDNQIICHEYWSSESMSDQQMQNFFTKIHPQHTAIMISAKAGISVQQYETILKKKFAM